MKRSWQREDAKKGGPALHTDKNWSEIGFLSVNWAIPEKRWELSIYNWNFLVCYFTHGSSGQNKAIHPKKPCKIIWHLLGMKPNSLWFFLLPLKIVVISFLGPGISTLYFFNIPGKSKSWNSQFRDFTWTENYW